ncbi:hypothetical protein F4820DRAFT_396915 [Hypoxylon rubiginosum]|uniref:Uncharacterized protein n=1 Tax=Hypoxylon rubiginosum TaxID=110542 RepID=A0ACB9YV33_9PEZI|nr:hypothetical protein F4820DRAFT_396915 [Hypoxylon rubiginosum]
MAADDVPTSSKAKARANDLLVYSQKQVDRVVSPPTRQKAYDYVRGLAIERPVLLSFILFQLSLSLAPLLLFAGFVTTTLAVSLISALMFSLFWMGIATLILVPTLFLTFSIALLFWAWAAATYFAGRWVYTRLPFGVEEDGKMVAKLPNGDRKVIFEKTPDIKAEAAKVKE